MTVDSSVVTYFQPFYNLRTRRLQGMEALARRRSAEGGHTELPAAFFDDASASGRMRELDLQILDEALAVIAGSYRSGGCRELILSVNFSWDLVGSPAFVGEISRALARHDVPADRLLVDIPTAMFRRLICADSDYLTRLHQLQHKEIAFCLDGFTVTDLDILPAAVAAPVDIIKLHPRQLAVVGDDLATRKLSEIAAAIQDAGLPVVAAGVETVEQLDLVRDLGFEWAQGFLLGEPLPAEQALSHAPALAG